MSINKYGRKNYFVMQVVLCDTLLNVKLCKCLIKGKNDKKGRGQEKKNELNVRKRFKIGVLEKTK